MQHESTHLSDPERQHFVDIVTRLRRDERIGTAQVWPAREHLPLAKREDLFAPDAASVILKAVEEHRLTANSWGKSEAPFSALVNHLSQAGAEG